MALKGSSLTAIDAIRTLARCNGIFFKGNHGKLSYRPAEGSENFKFVMHSRNGLLPAVRFHLEDSHLHNESLLTEAELVAHKNTNNGFLSLDYIFEKDFKEMFRNKRPEFYEQIKNLSIEDFVAFMMDFRENIDPFQLLKAEYQEAEKSIERRESVYWKEMLAVLSFAMNYPAKYLSAEDMLRLKETLMPLIGIVIAFVPQSSCEELFALYEAKVLEIVAVGDDREIRPEIKGGVTYAYIDENNTVQANYYQTFIDCVGQPHLSFDQFPFSGLLMQKAISPARLKFKNPDKALEAIANGNKEVEKYKNGDYYLKVPGIAINDDFQLVDNYGTENERIYMMAVPYIGGFNPDYSGLDFSANAAKKISKSILHN